MKLSLIMFLVKALEVLGLVFVIGMLFNLILDVVIIAPIHNRAAQKKKLEMMDLLLQKVKNGEVEIEADEVEEEVEE